MSLVTILTLGAVGSRGLRVGSSAHADISRIELVLYTGNVLVRELVIGGAVYSRSIGIDIVRV